MDGTPLLARLENEGRAALTSIEHAAAWLVGEASQAETSLNAMEASNPLVASAIAAGEAAARAHGVPVSAIENAGEAVLATARDLAAELKQTSAAAPAGGAT